MQPLLPLRVCITVGAAGLALIHILWPDLRIDAITLVLLTAAVLPWLQPILKTLKLPGGFELTMQEMKQEIRIATGAAQSAERKADLVVSGLVASHSSDPSRTLSPALSDLARRYERIRREDGSGPARTQAMTAVVREMIEQANELPRETLEVLLRAEQPGDRLAAYATLFARPNFLLLAELAGSVARYEDKPFGQYWGLQAIGRNLPAVSEAKIPNTVVADLKSIARRVTEGTDRHKEASKLLNQIGQRGEQRSQSAAAV